MSTKRRRFFEIATVAWAVALVILGAIHLTSGTAHADDDWLDCGRACSVACGRAGCESVYDWFGCGCTVYCEDGSVGDVVCV